MASVVVAPSRKTILLLQWAALRGPLSAPPRHRGATATRQACVGSSTTTGSEVGCSDPAAGSTVTASRSPDW